MCIIASQSVTHVVRQKSTLAPPPINPFGIIGQPSLQPLQSERCQLFASCLGIPVAADNSVASLEASSGVPAGITSLPPRKSKYTADESYKTLSRLSWTNARTGTVPTELHSSKVHCETMIFRKTIVGHRDSFRIVSLRSTRSISTLQPEANVRVSVGMRCCDTMFNDRR